MAYGNGYEQRDYNRGIAEGDYAVRLGFPVDKNVNGWELREIPITILSAPTSHPKKWTWFDRPNDGDLEKLARWNENMTCNADAFGVTRGDFRPESWAGKIGVVHIRENKKTGYMEVSWSVVGSKADAILKNIAGVSGQGSVNVQQEQPEVSGAVPPDFPDDIPF